MPAMHYWGQGERERGKKEVIPPDERKKKHAVNRPVVQVIIHESMKPVVKCRQREQDSSVGLGKFIKYSRSR